MKKIILSLAASMLLVGTAMAGEYAGADYSSKQKVGKDEQHDVYGVTVGDNIGKFTVEGRMENEIVHNPAKHEGLVQLRGAYNITNFHGFTPYVATAIGYKSKATSNFDYYVVEGGLKYDVTKQIQVKATSRLRTPFNETSVGEGNKYRTVENSLQVGFKFTPANQITAKVAREHGDSNYHTWGVGYVHSF
jgi:hypothetical protein